MATKAQPETSLVTPLDPSSDTHPDDWPEFHLQHASVHLPNAPDSPSSLLLASEHFPLTVIGQLQTPHQSVSHLYRGTRSTRTDAIEISDVRSFAYGQYENGNVALWAAGRAGWYNIKPSRAYRETFNEMIDAVKMLYFVADAYREPRRQGKKTLPEYSAQELFERYATDVMGLHKASAAEAAAKIYRHTEFLLASMLAGKEGLQWKQNPLFLQLKKKFPGVYMTVEERLAGPKKQKVKKATSQASQQQSSQSIDLTSPMSTTSSSLKRKRGRPRLDRNTEIVSAAKQGQPPLKKDVDVISLASTSDGSVAQKAQGTNVGPSAIRTTTKPARRTRQTASLDTTSAEPEPVTTPVLEVSESDEESRTGRAHKGKSGLRLKPSTGSKGTATKGKDKAIILEEEEEEPAEEESPAPRNAAGKRKREEDDASNSRNVRVRASRAEEDEGIDMPLSPPSSTTSDAVAGAQPAPDEFSHVEDPVQEDTWICALDGCKHKVYLASLPQSQQLIREHYALHAYDDDERVKMVKRLQAPSLPVSHLMEKVRLQAKVEGFPGSRVAGTRFPQPIVQRY